MNKKQLTKARKIITPHSEIAEIFKNKVVKLKGFIPSSTNAHEKGKKVLFPASAIGRKGAYEIRRLAKELQLNLIISGRTIESANFWEDLNTENFNGDFTQIGLIVYPTFIEKQPRQILKAISKRIPVITTSACGLDPSEQVKIVAFNNFEKLKNEVNKKLENVGI